MLAHPNALQWDRNPGHYEVYYLTLTDPDSEVGLWIRYTMVAPLPATGEPASCSLWFLGMDPHSSEQPRFARKATFPIEQLDAHTEPFRLAIGGATLSGTGMQGAFEDVAWDLRWAPGRPYEHVHPTLRAGRVASTILVLPHADVAVDGSVTFGGRQLELRGARAGQAHLWGSKHASRWAWVHAGDFTTIDGEPVADIFVDGVSVIVPRLGREVGPSTPVVGRLERQDFRSTSPLRVLANKSEYSLTHWRFEAQAGNRKLIGDVEADRDQLAGVTYHDPDGELAYCYNSETASMRLELWARDRWPGAWEHRTTVVSRGRAHFEYAQRAPVPGLDLMIT